MGKLYYYYQRLLCHPIAIGSLHRSVILFSKNITYD